MLSKFTRTLWLAVHVNVSAFEIIIMRVFFYIYTLLVAMHVNVSFVLVWW